MCGSERHAVTVKRLHTYVLRIVRDPDLAAAVTEDALFQAWREANGFNVHRGKVISWLLSICRALALDALGRVDGPQITCTVPRLRGGTSYLNLHAAQQYCLCPIQGT